MKPASTTIVSAWAMSLSAWLAMTTAIATAIGPVGPEIPVLVPPNADAKKPTATAPYSPAITPRPDATPKASASGNATTAAVNPPKASPRSVCRL